jgi:hypothetical protein
MAWELKGNAGNSPANNFVGTTDEQAVVIRTNDKEVVRIDADAAQSKVQIATRETFLMFKASVLASLLFTTAIAPAQALELKELMPCKAAALRICDRSEGLTMAALWKCGATLASRRHELGAQCVQVLVRYGQL